MTRKLFLAALALLAVVAGALATNLPPYSPVPSLQGNGLVNFANTNLNHNSHKTIFYVGNSTVWNATGYAAELCNYLNAPNVLANVGLTPCTTSISGYQALDSSGHIQITFSGSVPSGYTVGDVVLSQPVTNTLNTLLGAGVITAIGSSTINYTLISPNPLPASGSFVSSGGYFTNSFANLGYNGATSPFILSAVVPTLRTYVKAGDLVLVRGPLINDVRLGACNLACATANVEALYGAIAGAIPAAADIAWKTENSLLTTDPTSSGYVSPLGSSAAYTKILQNAVFQAFAALPSRAVVWDNMQIVFTKLGYEYATSAWMSDILHPNANGQAREAEADAQILSQVISGSSINIAGLSNPLGSTATNGANLAGFPSWIAALRNQVGFSEFMTEHAMVDDYAAPWTLYPDSVLDPDRYDVIAYGQVNSFGAYYVFFTWPSTSSVPTAAVEAGDLIWFMGSGVIQYPPGSSINTHNSGGVNYITSLSLTGNIIPAGVYDGQPVVVARQRTFAITDVPKFRDPATWTYRHRIEVPASGTNYLRVQFLDSLVSWPTAMTPSDYLELPCGEISMSSGYISNFSTYMQVNLSGSWAACQNEVGWVFGTHAMESNAALVTSSSTLQSACYAVASLPNGVQGMRACVNNQTSACPSPGAAFTAGGSVSCPAFYNGSAWVGD